jgi:hypothetical protein
MKIISWAWSNDKTLWQVQHDLGDDQTETSRSKTGGRQGKGHEGRGDIVKRLELAIQAQVRRAARQDAFIAPECGEVQLCHITDRLSVRGPEKPSSPSLRKEGELGVHHDWISG